MENNLMKYQQDEELACQLSTQEGDSFREQLECLQFLKCKYKS